MVSKTVVVGSIPTRPAINFNNNNNMKTSEAWWQETKASEHLINDWLFKQWRGEVTAASRIVRFAEQFATDGHAVKVLDAIAEQERTHASWIEGLLVARGLLVDAKVVEHAEKRYWQETLPGITDFETGAAVAAHAEGMRLARIRVIAGDETAPSDIRTVFERILKDEEWHERAFSELSSSAALEATKASHEAGMVALGLTI
jgi:rubrerythrin